MAWSDQARAAALEVRRRKGRRLVKTKVTPITAHLPMTFEEERARLQAGRKPEINARKVNAATKRLAKRAREPAKKYNIHTDMTTWRKK